MKNSILTIALMIIVTSTFGQLPFTFDLGLKGGINSSQINTENATINNVSYTDFKSATKSGYNLGIFARLGGKRMYLQPELLYCLKNGQSSSGSLITQTMELKTIQIPLLLGYKLIDLKVVSIRAFTGPAMSFPMTGSTIKSNLPNISPNNLKNNIWDWQLGAGVDILKFTFDVRYEWGLSNISGTIPDNISFVNKGNTLTFSVGFKFI